MRTYLLALLFLFTPVAHAADVLTFTDSEGTSMRLFDTPCTNEQVLGWLPAKAKQDYQWSAGEARTKGREDFRPGCWALGLSLDVVMGLEDESVLTCPLLAFTPEEVF
jgi:hypothetical protein